MPNRECPREWLDDLRKINELPVKIAMMVFPVVGRRAVAMGKRGLYTVSEITVRMEMLTPYGRAELARLEADHAGE